jgi:hypothetical protein
MGRIPPEPPSWDEPSDPDKAALDLRDQLAHAKARMKEHREVMKAAGLTTSPDHDVSSR